MEWWQKALVIWLGGNVGLFALCLVDHCVPTRWPWQDPRGPSVTRKPLRAK